MVLWNGPDWQQLFVPGTPLLEIFLRGSMVYLLLFTMLRIVLHRQAGGVSLTDLLLIVLIADAAQNAMIGESKAVPDGILLVATLIFWNYALDWLSFRFLRLRRLVHPPALLLMRNGRFMRRNMRRELVTEDELRSELRKHGIDDHHQVREAYMEGDGHISVIQKQPAKNGAGGSSPNKRSGLGNA